MRPADHFRAYKIYKFANHPYLERWMQDLLGPATMRRLAQVLGEFIDGTAPSHRAKAIFDFLARPRISAAYLSQTAGFIYETGAAVLGLLEGRRSVLDLGCHIGHLTTWFARADPARRVTGLDFSPVAIAAARQMAKTLGVTNASFQFGDLTRCNFGGRYDAVVDLRALKYAPNRRQCLAYIASRLEPGGVLIGGLPGAGKDAELLDDLDACGFRPESVETRTYDQHGVVHGLQLLTARRHAGGIDVDPAQVERRSRLGLLLGALGLLCRHRMEDGWNITRLMPGSFAERAGMRPGQRLQSVCGTPPDALDPGVLQAMLQAGRSVNIEAVPLGGTAPDSFVGSTIPWLGVIPIRQLESLGISVAMGQAG